MAALLLSNNSLNGTLPASWSTGLSTLSQVDLSHNRLSGERRQLCRGCLSQRLLLLGRQPRCLLPIAPAVPASTDTDPQAGRDTAKRMEQATGPEQPQHLVLTA